MKQIGIILWGKLRGLREMGRSKNVQKRRSIFGRTALVAFAAAALAHFSAANAADTAVNTAGADAGAANEQSVAELAKKVQNPISNLISVPFQNNTNFGIGPDDRTQNILNIQPVIPVNLGAIGLPEWNVINRTILPLVYQPGSMRGGEFGLSDINHSMFFSPADPGPVIWGVGPLISLPTSVNDRLGPSKLSFGPTAVALMMPGRWVFGALVSNQWSVAGDHDTPNVNSFLLQYFINYNLEGGWYLSSNPTITANWKADSGDKWVVPIGGGVGRVFRVGAQPMNIGVRGFWNAAKPTGGADGTLQVQVQLMFPK